MTIFFTIQGRRKADVKHATATNGGKHFKIAKYSVYFLNSQVQSCQRPGIPSKPGITREFHRRVKQGNIHEN